MTKYFNLAQDLEVERAGGFFCQGCLEGKPGDDMSFDPRYCQGCFDFLLLEAALLPPRKRPAWIPKRKRGMEKLIPVPQYAVLNMATLESEKIKVAIIQPPVAKVTYEKRGPKPKDLPVELITRWGGEGLGSKAIAARLKADCGIEVGFRTVARVIKGERQGVLV